jgi:predicted NAD/FAD-dependent oxidoreductase
MQSEPTAEIAELAPAPERRATANRRTGANSKRRTSGRTTGSEVVKLNSTRAGKFIKSTADARAILDPATSPKVAVIGVGISGLICASELKQAGVDVTVIEMGRGAGGRLATRREQGLPFDHGTQYFTCSHQRFDELVQEWLLADAVKIWDGGNFGSINAGESGGFVYVPADRDSLRRSEKRYIGTPTSNAICKLLEKNIGLEHFKYSTVVTQFKREQGQWQLLSNKEPYALGTYDVVVASAAVNGHPRFEKLYHSPPPLVDAMRPDLCAAVAQVEPEPCFSLMLAYDRALGLPFDLASFGNSAILARVSRENAKPGRETMWRLGDAFVPESTLSAMVAESSEEVLGSETPIERLVLLSTAGYGYSVVGRLNIHPEDRATVLAQVGDELLAAWNEVVWIITIRSSAYILSWRCMFDTNRR